MYMYVQLCIVTIYKVLGPAIPMFYFTISGMHITTTFSLGRNDLLNVQDLRLPYVSIGFWQYKVKVEVLMTISKYFYYLLYKTETASLLKKIICMSRCWVFLFWK